MATTTQSTALACLVLALGYAAPHAALAQEDDESSAESTESSDGAEADATKDGEPKDSEGTDAKDAAPAPEPRAWYFGPYLRYSVLPAFFLELGLDAAPTIDNFAFGATATHHSIDGASLELGIGYTDFSFGGPMRASGDPDTDTEWVDSDLALIHLTGSVLWHMDLIDKLSFEYGFGIDIGWLTGDIVRTEAYKTPGGYARCAGPQSIGPTSAYCEQPTTFGARTNAYDEDGAHYGVVEERVPPIGGSLMLPHLALRYEPIPEVAVKFEVALGFPVFFMGLSAAYGPEL